MCQCYLQHAAKHIESVADRPVQTYPRTGLLVILDCGELGPMQSLDGAIRSEMVVFVRLIQRPVPRKMIRTMFLG